MSASSSSQRQIMPRLFDVWRRTNRLHLFAGTLAFFRWWIPLFLVAVAIDWVVRLPAEVRGIAIIILLIVSFLKAWKAGWSSMRSFNATHTALHVEKHYGGMDSLLVTAIQHGQPGSTPGSSDAMREKACQMATEAVRGVQPEKVVSFQALRHPAMLALLPALVFIIFAISNGPFLGAGLGRFFAPWLETEYPTKTQLALESGDKVVKEGDALQILANLSGEVPTKAKIILKTGQGKPRERSLEVNDSSTEYKVGAVFRSFEYQIHAGDARSAWHNVKVVSAPKLEEVKVTLVYPEYTLRPEEVVEALNLTVPEGSKLNWKITLDRAVSKADFQPSGGDVQTMEISEDDRTVSYGLMAEQSNAYTFNWVDQEHGFQFESPRQYLQVAPDRSPTVELIQPKGNLIATMGRQVDYVYRARDDHGIGKVSLYYRLNKSGEEEVALPEQETHAEGGQSVDWDYREALPDLAIGDVLTVVIEVEDRYPGKEGPHVARSDGRRVQFVSKEDYLAHVEKQKRRLLTQIKSIYREEREIHGIVHNLDPADGSFTQACQLEAVRQDLISDRLMGIAVRMEDLVEDLAANNLSGESTGGELSQIAEQLRNIADQNVRLAANQFRQLATVKGQGEDQKDSLTAVHSVDQSARELGLLVLHLGFKDASDVMARELHATAQVQASLRLKTILKEEEFAGLPDAQTRLAQATERLLHSIPKNKESTPVDALVAFTLSRMVNQLVRTGAVTKMEEAAKLLDGKDHEKAARLQADVIAAFLRAEFRLRQGSEFEALARALDLFLELTTEQEGLLSKDVDADTQDALFRKLQLLLMPEIPAPRALLFDSTLASPPPVQDLLAGVEDAMQQAASEINTGKPDAAQVLQTQAAKDLKELATIVQTRMHLLTEEVQLRALSTNSNKFGGEILIMEERLLQLLEKTEDAAADEINTASLTILNQQLQLDILKLARNIKREKIFGEGDMALAAVFTRAGTALENANPFLKENKPNPAIENQEMALEAIEEAMLLVEDMAGALSSYSKALQLTSKALDPSPKLAEIEDEQVIMLKATEKAKPEDYPSLIIPQKNLVHAVNAVLDSMDALAHKVESGTVLLFAKDDMDAAAIGLAEDDIEEALDAQSFVAESMAEIRGKIDAVTPQYRYIREVVEFLYGVLPNSYSIQLGVKEIQSQSGDAPAMVALNKEIKQFGDDLHRATGDERFSENALILLEAIAEKNEEDIEDAIYDLQDDSADISLLLKNLAYLISPPPDLSNVAEPTPEVKLILQTLDVASYHMDLIREAHTSSDGLTELAAKQEKLEKQCAELLPASESHPKLVAAQKHLAEAAAKFKASEREAALTSQLAAREDLRHFIIEYALEYVDVPPPPPPEEGGPSEDSEPEDSDLDLLMPGALTGTRPKGGRQEWQVLGRRNRAALNENFARELPLEYRAILKDYYERLTE